MRELPILISWQIPIGISSARSTLKKCTNVLSSILVIIHSLFIQLLIHFRILHNLRVVFRTISSIYDAETLHYRYLASSKYDSAASYFNISPLSSFEYLNKCMNILLFFSGPVQPLWSHDVNQ